jgi:predicted GIY-YIG superfamily endonuclease
MLKAMTFYTYVLRCRDGSHYVGCTSDIVRRVTEHRTGKGGRYTWRRRPVTLVYVESFPDRASAARRERRLKGWTSARLKQFLDDEERCGVQAAAELEATLDRG